MKQFTSKQEIRIYHRKLRDAMETQEKELKSASICRRIAAADWYQNAKILYAYYPLGNEADCLALAEAALEEEKTVALPRVLPDGLMEFYRITSLSQVKEGSFHVMEPVITGPPMCEESALVLVPGVVFDKKGGRYGYGKGYYDRYFSRYPNLYRAAAAFEHQIEEELELLDTDVRMDVVCTESAVYQMERKWMSQ